MNSAEVIIIGGGPAGASCAWRLAQHGVDTLVLDAQTFPRLKLCAGWVTPKVLNDLQLDPALYPQRFNTFDKLIVHLFGLTFQLKTTQHSIRRFEFDDWLLKRSAVPVIQHNVRDIKQDTNGFVIDDQYRAKYLIGAGGTKCPVYRTLFRDVNPRAREQQTVTLEHEFAYDYRDPNCHLWFFRKWMPGYSWYVPKANGYLNIGIGAMAQVLKNRNDDIWRHWEIFINDLAKAGLVTDVTLQPKGYSYYLRDRVDTVRLGNAFIIGDAVGLATIDMAEGIGPAIQSGLRAADAIVQNKEYDLRSIEKCSIPLVERNQLLQKLVRH